MIDKSRVTPKMIIDERFVHVETSKYGSLVFTNFVREDGEVRKAVFSVGTSSTSEGEPLLVVDGTTCRGNPPTGVLVQAASGEPVEMHEDTYRKRPSKCKWVE